MAQKVILCLPTKGCIMALNSVPSDPPDRGRIMAKTAAHEPPRQGKTAALASNLMEDRASVNSIPERPMYESDDGWVFPSPTTDTPSTRQTRRIPRGDSEDEASDPASDPHRQKEIKNVTSLDPPIGADPEAPNGDRKPERNRNQDALAQATTKTNEH
jgi:hypothetical protein